jgi:hypothetical protein
MLASVLLRTGELARADRGVDLEDGPLLGATSAGKADCHE